MGSLDSGLVSETLKEARDNATFAEPDEWTGLATPADVAGAAVPDLDLWREDLLSVSTDEKVRYAIELDARVSGADPRIRGVESTSYGDGAVEAAVASSTGVEATVRRTVCSASSEAMAEADGQTQTGYGFSVGRTFSDLDADQIVAMATERALRLLGARQPKSRRLAVVLDPLVTAQFLGVLSAAFNGESMLKGRSLFLDRVGEQVGAPIVHLADDPTDAMMPGATTHDAEGVPCRRNPLVAAGVLQGFLHNSATARRAGTATTGSATRGGYTSTPGVGMRALRLEPGTRGPDDIIASLPDALYVQSVSGLHSGTNPISGDFSVGAEGLDRARRRARRTGARGDDRVDVAAHAPRHRRDRLRRHRARRQHRRRHARRLRDDHERRLRRLETGSGQAAAVEDGVELGEGDAGVVAEVDGLHAERTPPRRCRRCRRRTRPRRVRPRAAST